MSATVRIDNKLFFEDQYKPSTIAKAFISTNNENNHILVTLNESNVAGSIKSVFAGVRKDHNNNIGILITVIFSDSVAPSTSIVLLTVQQDGNPNYGNTEPYIA
ncbi:MAG: hypothetical protein JWR12_1686 [Mucilaginibacter sp.]|nr:hypothetical protein [Mucilaginibacter sp.]